MKEFKSFFKDVDNRKFNTWCRWTKRLDTYGCGCAHDCKYCYAKSLLDFRGLWNATAPAVADLKKIEARIKKLPAGSVVRLGGMTDCFQPIEKQLRVTYETIKLLNKYGIGYLIVTKSHIVADDEYMAILDKNLAQESSLSFHPNDNRATVVIGVEEFMRYLNAVGNSYEFIELYDK